MSRPHLFAACLAILIMVQLGAADNTPPEGFTALFNGKDFTGWKVPEGDNGHWKIANGIIDYDGKSESKEKHLWSEAEFGDVTIHIDWRWSGKPYKIKHPLVLPSGDYKKDDNGG